MSQKRKGKSPRLILSAGTCIIIAVLLSLVLENVRIGLLVGLVLGVLGGSVFRRSTRKEE